MNTEVSTVPNGTPPTVLNGTLSRLDELVEQYKTFAKRSAENVIRAAETVFIASREFELSPEDLQTFKKRVGLDQRDDSTYRKLRKIGEEVTRFEPFVHRLPNSWTTLWELAKLDPDQFDQVTEDSRFAPAMTAAELDDILAGKPPVDGEGDSEGDDEEDAGGDRKSKGASAGGRGRRAGRGRRHAGGGGDDHTKQLGAFCITIPLNGLESKKKHEVLREVEDLGCEFACTYMDEDGCTDTEVVAA
jgi:hypothetical protein